MLNLSETDSAAATRLDNSGWDLATREQILESGNSFRQIEGVQGDSFYGFSSKNYAKAPDSPYWLDETTYSDLQGRYQNPSTGEWDSAGVKNELALPCFNQANSVYQGQLIQSQNLVVSTINPAQETVTYLSGDGEELTSFTRTMTGGGTQFTPNKGTITNVSEYLGR